MSDDMKPNPLQNLKAVAHMAEVSGLHIDDLRVMPAAGVADIVYEAKDRIEELEERLKAATDDAKEAEAYAGELEAELHLLKTSGIIEVAVRNPNVMEYMRHWEGRAEAAEVALEKAMKIADEGRTSGRVSRFMYEMTGGKDE